MRRHGAWRRTRPQQVTVTATRIPKAISDMPAAVDVVDQDAVQLARQQIGLDESLAQVPGLFMQDRYNFAQDLRISIRGFGARSNFGIRGVRIFVDGIPETLPDGQGQVDSVDLGSVERITVLRGSASALYGNAVGRRDPHRLRAAAREDRRSNARLSFGEFGFSKHQLKVGGTAGKLGFMVNLADMEMDGYRAQSDVESRSRQRHTALCSRARTPSFRVAFNYTGPARLRRPRRAHAAKMSMNDRRQRRARGATFDGGESARADARRLRVRQGVRRAPQHHGAQLLRVAHVREHARLPGGRCRHHRPVLRRRRRWRTRTTARSAAGPTGSSSAWTSTARTMTAGASTTTSARSARSRSTRPRKSSNTGIFLQDELTLIDALTLTLGVRHDNVEFDVSDHFLGDGDDSGQRTLRETSPMVGAALPR